MQNRNTEELYILARVLSHFQSIQLNKADPINLSIKRVENISKLYKCFPKSCNDEPCKDVDICPRFIDIGKSLCPTDNVNACIVKICRRYSFE